MGSDRTTICGISDLYLLAKVKDPSFNLSDFTRKCLEHYLFGEEIQDPRKEAARRAAESILLERQKQKQIIAEEQSYEDRARELVERETKTFNKEAHAFFRNPDLFSSKLPEYDTYGDFLDTWNEIADRLTTRCGFTVTTDQCMTYVRQQAGGV